MTGTGFIVVLIIVAGLSYAIGRASCKTRGPLVTEKEADLDRRLYQKQRQVEDRLKERERLFEIRMEEAERDRKSKIEEREQWLSNQGQRVIQETLRVQENREYVHVRDEAFRKDFLTGRRWLADFVAESSKALDDAIEYSLRHKRRPAEKTADVLKRANSEKRALKSRVKFLEYQLRSYEEYFPFLEDYRELILEERIPLAGDKDNRGEIEKTDPVRQILNKEEYDSLTPVQRNQLALERYRGKPKNNWEIGRLYERYVGYLYEQEGWNVTYYGAIKGFEDFGRDLICIKDNTAKIVQAKYWARDKLIREKHIFQLFGTTILYGKRHPTERLQGVFCTTTELSPEAKEVAKALKITVRIKPYSSDYPMIKCNVNPATKDKKIYHLPLDQQYDRVVIGTHPGECYVKTCQEAEKLGFRRAWRYKGPF